MLYPIVLRCNYHRGKEELAFSENGVIGYSLRLEGEAELTIVDGRTVMAGMALAWLEVAGRGSIVQAAVLDVDEPLLGMMALEALGLA